MKTRKRFFGGLSLSNRFPSSDPIWQYSDPKQAQKMAYKYLGKEGVLYRSENVQKKYRVFDKMNKKWVNFGQMGYEDYTKHKNKTRRQNYLTRSAGIFGSWKANKYSANNLSRNVIW